VSNNSSENASVYAVEISFLVLTGLDVDMIMWSLALCWRGRKTLHNPVLDKRRNRYLINPDWLKCKLIYKILSLLKRALNYQQNLYSTSTTPEAYSCITCGKLIVGIYSKVQQIHLKIISIVSQLTNGEPG